ncbi:MAG: T9SS type A sorting domain-containing protein [Saprospiraceae bacterium]|nr:T9SS type A sorting domain-containing protein [Saprospiraceae bacterium]
MKNITLFYTLVLTLGFTTAIQAQHSIDRQVIGSAGALCTSGSGASLLFTAGEMAIQTVAAHTILTQGFHLVSVERTTLASKDAKKEAAVNMQVFPNPASDYLHIQSEQTLEVTLVNLQGQVVIPSTTILQAGQLDIQHLSTGTYMLHSTLENGAPASSFKIQVIH